MVNTQQLALGADTKPWMIISTIALRSIRLHFTATFFLRTHSPSAVYRFEHKDELPAAHRGWYHASCHQRPRMSFPGTIFSIARSGWDEYRTEQQALLLFSAP